MSRPDDDEHDRTARRVVVFGNTSFIARRLVEAGRRRRLAIVAVPHSAAADDVLCGGDAVINCALHPAYSNRAYETALDVDLQIARAAAQAGAHFTMLSTRRVYPSTVRWDAREDGPAMGDETIYGQNKARTEAAIGNALKGQVTILRLSNIIGFEYEQQAVRLSFMGRLLRTLRRDRVIRYDMHPATRRDFLPAEDCANAILTASLQRLIGTWNLGAGFAVSCGDIADWIMLGYGGGRLIVENAEVRDEFVLNMDKWRAVLPPSVSLDRLRRYCIELGEGLQRA